MDASNEPEPINQPSFTNERGNQVRNSFVGGERYRFDFEVCKAADGWLQFYTDQDAAYFGRSKL